MPTTNSQLAGTAGLPHIMSLRGVGLDWWESMHTLHENEWHQEERSVEPHGTLRCFSTVLSMDLSKKHLLQRSWGLSWSSSASQQRRSSCSTWAGMRHPCFLLTERAGQPHVSTSRCFGIVGWSQINHTRTGQCRVLTSYSTRPRDQDVPFPE